MPNLLDRRIYFGGDMIPARIASSPRIIRPARKTNVTSIPGTSRQVVEMEDAWETYDQPYSLFVGDGSMDSIQEELDKTAEVLYKKGWYELYDEYDPEYYRLAYYVGPFDVENRKTRVGVFEITFKCRPEKFLMLGKTPVSILSNGKIVNPTAFDAKPLIHIEGSGNATLTINGKTMTFTGIVDYLNIDCDAMDIYRLPAENRNSLMEGEFPVLSKGENIVSFSSGITSVIITPRFWTI
jgi:phage-related protein